VRDAPFDFTAALPLVPLGFFFNPMGLLFTMHLDVEASALEWLGAVEIDCGTLTPIEQKR
jgi:hypothetical protein